uniref:Uncharacterized protein n=1 Tax=Glossina morsitans morsitans TaxID=37546 RepID=A0ABK9NFW1_GLOMM
MRKKKKKTVQTLADNKKGML